MVDLKVGMRYEEVRKKSKRFQKLGAENVVNSLINQARLGEGEDAAFEIAKELTTHTRSFSGAGNKQVGIGEGYKLGDGRWRRNEKGVWERT